MEEEKENETVGRKTRWKVEGYKSLWIRARGMRQGKRKGGGQKKLMKKMNKKKKERRRKKKPGKHVERKCRRRRKSIRFSMKKSV